MKNMMGLKPCALALLAAAAVAPAFAQSSNVTIYGRLNESIERQKVGTANSTWVLQNNSSRIGFKGTESINNNLTAGFQLEHGFDADTGASTGSTDVPPTPFWARQAEVNLGSNQAGMVRLGRFTSEAYYATADYVSMHNHDTGTSADALYAGNYNNSNRIAYRSPTFNGGSVEIARSFGEGATPNPTYDLAANWASGPLQLGAGYNKEGDKKQFAVRALYDLGQFVVGGYIQRDKDNWAPVVLGSRTNFRLAAMYKVDSNSELHFNIGRAGKVGSVADTEATQYTLGYNYNLSKRTKVYAFYTKLNTGNVDLYNKGAGDFSSLATGIRVNF